MIRRLVGLVLAAAVLAACGQSAEDRAVDEFSTICTELGVELAEVRPSADTPIRAAAPELVAAIERAIERMRGIDGSGDVGKSFDQAIQKLISATNSLDVAARSTTDVDALAQFETAIGLAQEAYAVLEPFGVECGAEE